jgi:DNA-binding transcriptional regulator YhcF (GntR family)
MRSLRDKILDHLAFAIKRDEAKGGTGHRSTREVADRAGVNINQARRELNRLVITGAVEVYKDELWRVLWKLRRDS